MSVSFVFLTSCGNTQNKGALGLLKSTESIEVLINILLNDKEEMIRSYAAESLGEIDNEKAVEPLNKTIANDLSEFVRDEAKEAIELIKSRNIQ